MQLGRESENIGLFYWYLQRLVRRVGGLQVLTVRWELLWGLCWPQGMELLAMSEMWFFSSDGTWNQDAVEEKYTYIFCLGKGTDISHSFYHHWQMFADTLLYKLSFPVAQMVKSLPAMWETGVQSLGQEDPLEKEMLVYSNILAWQIAWTEEPGRVDPGRVHGATKSWTWLKWLNTHMRVNVIYIVTIIVIVTQQYWKSQKNPAALLFDFLNERGRLSQ